MTRKSSKIWKEREAVRYLTASRSFFHPRVIPSLFILYYCYFISLLFFPARITA